MTPDRVADWVALVDECYPETDAEGWDAVGLHVGGPDDPVSAVLVCLDVTDATLDEACRLGANLVLAHHPLLFRPLGRLTPATAPGRLALRAARERIAILAAHTNVDAAVSGTTEPVVDLLGLVDVRPLAPTSGPGRPARCKLVTVVPREQTAAVLAALSEAGAEDARSFRVDGDRLEIVVPRSRLGEIVDALLDARPHEPLTYELRPLPKETAHKGLGRIGRLPEPQPLGAVACRLAAGLPAPFLRASGELNTPIRTVAACGGAGDGLIDRALRAGADVYVTGDLRHHVTLDARTMGMALIDAGHYATEAAALPALRATLAEAASRRGLAARLLASAVSTEPWSDWSRWEPWDSTERGP